MSRPRRRAKPAKPRDLVVGEDVVVEADRLRLPSNATLVVEDARRADAVQGIRGNEKRARRQDVFDLLRPGMAPASYEAARRLERDLIIRAGEHDRGRALERIDGDRPHGRTDAQIAAGSRVDTVMARIGLVDGWLLLQLIRPGDRAWREVVRQLTGETHEVGQGAAVRSACANLARAYEQRQAA